MAKLEITKQTTLGLDKPHTMTDWKVGFNVDCSNLLTESLNDTINLLVWNTPLIDNTGKMYDGTDTIYAKCRVRYGDDWSDWFNVNLCVNGVEADLEIGFVYKLPAQFVGI